MSFTPTPLDGSSTPIPMSSAVPDGTNTPLALEGGPSKTTGGNPLVPVATYQYDGYNVTLGSTTDTAATTDTGTFSLIALFKRLLSKLPVIGPQVKAASMSITIASDQGNIGVSEANSTSIKTDLDSIVTNTNKIPASPAQEGGNLATLAGIVSSSKAAIKAASGDFADGAVVAIGTTTQTKATDGSATSWSAIQLLKGIIDKLLNTLAVTQSGTWTVQPGNTANTTAWKVDGSAVTQPVSGTVTANAGTNMSTASLALETGGNLATLVPGVQGWIAATGTGTATTDDTLTFANQVRKVYLHNTSTANVPFEFDVTATATSDFIEPGQRLIIDNVLCTTVHVFPSALLPINTTSGLYVKGWK